MGLTPVQAKAAIDAIDAKRLEVEIRLSETTKLGEWKDKTSDSRTKQRVTQPKPRQEFTTDKDYIIGVIDIMKKYLQTSVG